MAALLKMLKKQKIQSTPLKTLNLQRLPQPSQRRLKQQKRKLKSQSLQPLRHQRPTIKLLKPQKPPKQRLLQLPPQLLPLKKKKLKKHQLLKRRFKPKLMLKRVKANPILIPIHLIPTVIEHYMSITFIIFKKFSHCKM